MAAIARLVTYADLHDWPGEPASQVSCSAVLKAELVDGRQIVLLDDRGWSMSVFTAGEGAPADQWSYVTRDDVEETARMVVGSDEPADGESHEEAERIHWSFLAAVLEAKGVAASADDLRSLPHVVVLSDRLRGRMACDP